MLLNGIQGLNVKQAALVLYVMIVMRSSEQVSIDATFTKTTENDYSVLIWEDITLSIDDLMNQDGVNTRRHKIRAAEVQL